MIVGRGGGSLEDLWAFNEEIVARAIHASRIPIISGVGHEVDVTIADLVADLRAATPTAAAELAVPVLEEVLDTLASLESRQRRGLRQQLEQRRLGLERLVQSPWLRDPLALVRHEEQRLDETLSRLRLAIAQRLGGGHRRLHELQIGLSAVQPRTLVHRRYRRLGDLGARLQWVGVHRLAEAGQQLHRLEVHLVAADPRTLLGRHGDRLHDAGRRLEQLLHHRMELARTSLEALDARVQSCSHRKTLGRGYTITRRRSTGQIVTAAAQVSADEQVVTETADGNFTSRVMEKEEGR